VIIIANPLNQILEPFKGIDIAATYKEYYLFIDFIIYLVIFTGLAQFVFGKRFPGRGGKAISIGMALTLSVGMSIFSATTGFRLANFGPLAAGIAVLLVGLLVYGFIKHLGGNTLNSGIISFIITYFLIRSVSPELYEWSSNNQFAAWIDAALLLSIPILIIILVSRLKSRLPGSTSWKLPNISKNSALKEETSQEVNELEQRKNLEKKSVKAEKRAQKTEKHIERDINAIISLLNTESLTDANKSAINQALNDIRRQDNRLAILLNQIKLISQKLEKWQINGFKKLTATYQKLNPTDQKRLKQAIQAEQQTIIKNRVTENLEKRINQNHQQFLKQLSLAINQIGHQNRKAAIYYLVQAQSTEKESKTLHKQLKNLQKQLLQLTRAEIELINKIAA